MREVFLDSSYAIALSVHTDQHHEKAATTARQLKSEHAILITTRAVVLEIGDALAKQRFRAAAGKLLRALEVDPNLEVVSLGEDLYEGRPDKEWGLTDCVSFTVMQNRGLTEALTADVHFQQAGFHALLRG